MSVRISLLGKVAALIAAPVAVLAMAAPAVAASPPAPNPENDCTFIPTGDPGTPVIPICPIADNGNSQLTYT